MTLTPPGPGCARGPLISVEGINGVGKNYLTHRALHTVEDAPLLLPGFSQRADEPPRLDARLLDALRESSPEDPFLRGGAPRAEALLLMAIKRHDLDTVLPALAAGRAVIEGRSLDTTAVCQALLLHPEDPGAALATARDLLDLGASFRPLPDLTVLVTDDASQALLRAQRRDHRVFTAEQAAFMRAAGALYERLAATDPARYRIVDRRSVGEQEAAVLLRGWIGGAGEELGCLREPWQERQGRCMCCGRRPQAAPA